MLTLLQYAPGVVGILGTEGFIRLYMFSMGVSGVCSLGAKRFLRGRLARWTRTLGASGCVIGVKVFYTWWVWKRTGMLRGG
jgi:hypothetical protein